ncbi:hypothetical protein FEP08_05596 [Burkholderia multivorans]|nr:hypothetical protein [Burkholderia multivorans]
MLSFRRAASRNESEVAATLFRWMTFFAASIEASPTCPKP